MSAVPMLDVRGHRPKIAARDAGGRVSP